MAENHQSSYTGAQLDAAIASYANRTTGQIILTPDVLTSSLSDGYYSGISASLNYSALTAEDAHVLAGKSAIGKYGKITNGGIANNGAGSITLDKDHLSKSIGGGYYSGVSASFDGTGLNATGAQILTGYTAVTSGGKTPGQMQSGNVSLTLTPSNLSPSTSPNKFVPSASASLDYSSLTAGAGSVLQGMTFIGKDGVGSGSLVAYNVQTGESPNPTSNTVLTITGLTGTPSNLMLVYNFNSSASTSGSVAGLYYINGSAFQISASNTSSMYSRTSASVVFNHSAGTCTITLSSDRFFRGKVGDKYKYVVW